MKFPKRPDIVLTILLFTTFFVLGVMGFGYSLTDLVILGIIGIAAFIAVYRNRNL